MLIVSPKNIQQEHSKAEEEKAVKERQDPRTGDEFLLNVGGEVTFVGHLATYCLPLILFYKYFSVSGICDIQGNTL